MVKQWFTLAVLSGKGSVSVFQGNDLPCVGQQLMETDWSLVRNEHPSVMLACHYHLGMTVVMSLALFHHLLLQSCALLRFHYMPCLLEPL